MKYLMADEDKEAALEREREIEEAEEEEEGPQRTVTVSFTAKCPSEYSLTDIKLAIEKLANNEPEFDEVYDIEVDEV